MNYMKFNKSIYFFILVIINIFPLKSCFCQTFKYGFTPRHENFIDTIPSDSWENEFSWTSTQEDITDSSFVFRNILCQCDTCYCCGIIFKTNSSGNWYIIDSGKEFIFFDKKKPQSLKPMYLETCDKNIVVFAYQQLVKDALLYKFTVEDNGWISGDTTIYWFSEKFGIVAVQSTALFVRDDFIEHCK